jgi:hypothetical protein
MGGYETLIPGTDRYKSLANVLVGFEPPVLNYDSNKINWPIALNAYYGRAHRFFLFNSDAAQVDQMNRLETNELAKLRQGVADGIVENSIEWGQNVANAIIAYSETDREGALQSRQASPSDYFPPSGDGLWEPTLPDLGRALFPRWGSVRTFAAKHGDLVSLPPAHKYSTDPSSNYYQENLEVANRAMNITEKDRWIAEFWSDDLTGLTFSPPARFFAIANQVVAREEMNLMETAHMYCLLGIATNDAAVACWKSKYIYNTERPVKYITQFIDPDFKSRLGEAIGIQGMNPA